MPLILLSRGGKFPFWTNYLSILLSKIRIFSGYSYCNYYCNYYTGHHSSDCSSHFDTFHPACLYGVGISKVLLQNYWFKITLIKISTKIWHPWGCCQLVCVHHTYGYVDVLVVMLGILQYTSILLLLIILNHRRKSNTFSMVLCIQIWVETLLISKVIFKDLNGGWQHYFGSSQWYCLLAKSQTLILWPQHLHLDS